MKIPNIISTKKTITWFISTISFVDLWKDFLNIPLLVKYSLAGLLFILTTAAVLSSIKGIRYFLTVRSIGLAFKKKRTNSSDNDYVVRKAENFEELKVALEIDKDTYDEENNWSIPRWQSFYEKNNSIAYTLYASDKMDEPLGGISIFPLTEKAAQELATGAILESELVADHLLAENQLKSCKNWHIGGIIIFPHRKKMIMTTQLLIGSLKIWLSDIKTIPFKVTAFAYSSEGSKLLKKFRFIKIGGKEELPFYRMAISSTQELFDHLPGILQPDSNK